MPLVVLDFETYYNSKTFTLSKMTMEEYIRDPRFEVIGVGLRVDNTPARWYVGADVAPALAEIDWGNTVAVAHNALFDAAILRWVYGHKPLRWWCTMKMARAMFGLESSVSLKAVAERFGIGQKGDEVLRADGKRLADFTPQELEAYGRYCINDVELTARILSPLLTATPPTEREMVAWTVEQFADPVLDLDVPLLERELTELRTKLEKARAETGMTVAALRSDGAFAAALEAVGVDPPRKISPTTGQETWAFSKQDTEFMDLLEHDDPRVVALVEARLGNKTSIAETRLERFIGIGKRGKLPVPLAYAGAMTTKRWGGTDSINLQNLPKKGGIRHAIKAPRGAYMVAGDLSQIELRVNAWQSGQQEILDELTRPGGDTYSAMASSIYGYAVTKEEHPVERFVGKTAVLGCGYGCGATRFASMLRVSARQQRIVLPDESDEFAATVVGAYRAANQKIVRFWREAQDAIPRLAAGVSGSIGPYHYTDGKLFLPNGQYLYYPNLRRKENDEWVYDKRLGRTQVEARLYGPKLVENITQAVARLPMCDAIARLWTDYGRWCRPVFTVHDEVVTLWHESVPKEEAMAAVKYALTTIKDTTLSQFFSGLPLAAEVKAGTSYGEVK